MILDVERFLYAERPVWEELSALVEAFAQNPEKAATVEELARFHYLYQRAVSSLARLRANAADPALERPLEILVARAYGEIHQRRGMVRGKLERPPKRRERILHAPNRKVVAAQIALVVRRVRRNPHRTLAQLDRLGVVA